MDVRAVLDALDRGQPIALATVVACAGSTPRHLGARMAVWAEGQDGTIGGGRIELEVTAAAREVAAGGPARRVVHHLVRDLAMCCGGRMAIAIGPAAASRAALAEIVRAADERRRVVVETPGDGGPLLARPPVGDERALTSPRAADDRLIELWGPTPRAIIVGAGHVGRALGPLVAALGFEVIVADDGETGALAAPLPWAARVIESFELVDLERALGPLGAGNHVFIVTRDHALNQRLLEAIIGNDDLAYLGLIGSRGKVGRFEKRLRAKGKVDDARWARLHAPVGLDLGAETPAEIAVAIAAELVALRRGRAVAHAWTAPGGGEAP